MSRQTFTWHPDLGAQRTKKPNVHQTKFGDGYEVRTAWGINTSPGKYSVRFTRNYEEISAILAFIEARKGLESFYWTDTLGQTAIYVCREWNVNQKMFGVYELSATFEQVFEV